ncbi:MAG: hypothetical protein ABSG11_21630 [Candidatus Korobacteraceae bacterium]|jgi:hypothetical protein
MHSASVRLRLSALQVGLILPALRLIVAADYQYQTTGGIVRARHDIRFYENRVDTTKYKPAGMKPFADALDKLSALAQRGGRVRLDCYQLAACMIAARHVRVMIRHGHLKPWLNHEVATDRLVEKLERYRRRARRLYEKHLGVEAYRDAGTTWAYILGWIHTNYLWCGCNRHQRPSFLRAWYRSVVDRCVELAAEGLLRRHRYPPQEDELRKLVRRALRSARRCPSAMPVKLILERPREGGDFLADFILRTSGKELPRCDLSTRQSARAETLEVISMDTDAA